MAVAEDAAGAEIQELPAFTGLQDAFPLCSLLLYTRDSTAWEGQWRWRSRACASFAVALLPVFLRQGLTVSL